MTNTHITIFLFIISFLLTILIALAGFIGRLFSIKINQVDKKFEVVFAEFKEYQTKEICKIHRDALEAKDNENGEDINRVGKKISDHLKEG